MGGRLVVGGVDGWRAYREGMEEGNDIGDADGGVAVVEGKGGELAEGAGHPLPHFLWSCRGTAQLYELDVIRSSGPAGHSAIPMPLLVSTVRFVSSPPPPRCSINDVNHHNTVARRPSHTHIARTCKTLPLPGSLDP